LLCVIVCAAVCVCDLCRRSGHLSDDSVLRDEYRDQTTLRIKREVGTAKFLHGADLDKLTRFAQDREAWAVLVSHIKHRTQQQWVQKDGERKGREAPWSLFPGPASQSRRGEGAPSRGSSAKTTVFRRGRSSRRRRVERQGV